MNKENINIENSSVCLIKLINTVFLPQTFKKHHIYNEIKDIKNNKILPKKIKFSFMDLLEQS